MVFALSLAGAADPAIVRAAEAPSSAITIDIPGGRLSDALSALVRQSGISFGMAGPVPNVAVHAIKGKMRPAVALDRLLDGTGLRAVATGPSSFRLEPVPRPARAAPARTEAPVPIEDIVVTGVKRTQELAHVPVSVAVISLADDWRLPPLAQSRDITAIVDGLTLTNIGPGQNRQFIRGVADSPFSGTSQSTVAIQIDDARVAYDAPDPELRLVDVERVEILKGPQGPLYGSGALGGVYHVVTRRPDLDDASASVEVQGSSVATGGLGGSVQAVANLPIVTDRLAVRAVGYAEFEPGWIDNDDGRQNSNDTHVHGGRLSIRWRPHDDWTVDTSGIVQLINQDDSQYVTRSAETLHRASLFAEPHDNDFRMVSATVTGRIGAVDIVSATSFVDQEISGTLDASASAAAFGVTGPLRYTDDRSYTVLNQEIRLSQSRDTSFSWIAGLSWVRAESDFKGDIASQGQLAVPVVATNQEITELAAFAEVSLPLDDDWRIIGGGRLFRSVAQNERHEAAQALLDRRIKSGFTPSLGLSWTPAEGQFYFLRFASALRPGGLSLADGMGEDRFASDELMNLDLGWRIRSADKHLSIEGAAYVTHWDHIQSDYLLANGLVATHNAGNGRIYGIESTIRWRATPGWLVEAGFTAQQARLIKAESRTVIGDDGRLPVVPDISLRLGLARRISLGDWHGEAGTRVNFVGSSRLSFDQGLDRHMGEYATFGTSASLSNGDWTLSARIDNLFDARGDSFALGNPFSIRTAPQFTPLRPRSLAVGLGRRW